MLLTNIKTILISIAFALCFNSHITASEHPPFSINFDYSPQSPIDEVLITKSELSTVFNRLEKFVAKNFKLKRNVSFHFQDVPFFSSTTSEQNNLIINIPFSFLYQLNQGLTTNYPQQPEIQGKIYRAAVEKLLWIELGRVLIDDYGLTLKGETVFALDNFSTLMLLDQYHVETDYILDATEAYLLIDQTIPYLDSDAYEDEVALDDDRYRKAVCLILGKDYMLKLEETEQPYYKLITDLAWNKRQIELCKRLYKEKIALWARVLTPHLVEGSRLSTWHASETESTEKTTSAAESSVQEPGRSLPF